jgi:hypothetical protein
MNKKKPTKKLLVLDNFTWGTLKDSEYKWIFKIANRAIERVQSNTEKGQKPCPLVKRGVHSLIMDLEVCHAKHHKLRLKEMAETEDNFSFMHDIHMIVNSINRKTYGWDTIGMPRFSR